MLKKLMRMEERIVLDGAAVADAAGNSASGNADTHDNTLTPSAENQTDNDSSTFDSTDDSDTGHSNDLAGEGIGADATQDSAEAGYVADAVEDALDSIDTAAGDSEPLQALIVNNDLTDSADLIAAAADNIIVITYDSDTSDLQDILDQLESIADGREYDSIALATHSGAGGEIVLTDAEHVSDQSLSSDTEQIAFFAGLGDLLTAEGRIDLMSCYTGLGDSGDNLIAAIEDISGREVAASTDATGNETVGGDWILEKGDIDVSSIYFDQTALTAYTSTLDNELQTIISNPEDQNIGEQIEYWDNYTADVSDDTLAVLKTINDTYYISMYRNSSYGFTLETNIELGDSSLNADIALSSYDSSAHSQVLVASLGNTVYIFEEGSSGWSTITSTSNAVDSASYTGSNLSVDIIGSTLAVGDSAESVAGNANSGNVFIYNKTFDSTDSWNLTTDLQSTLFPKIDCGTTPNFGRNIELIDVNLDFSADQLFITSNNGYTTTTGAICDGLYMVSMSETASSSIEVTTSNREFSTEAGSTIDDFEIISYYNGSDYCEDIFVSYYTNSNFTTSLKYSVDNTLDVTGGVLSFNSTPSYSTLSSITSYNTVGITMSGYASQGGATRNIALAVDPSTSIGSKDVSIYQYASGSYTEEASLITANDPLNLSHENQAFGSAMVFLNASNLLISAPSVDQAGTNFAAEKQGIFHISYNGSDWGSTIDGTFQSNIAAKVIAAPEEYLNKLGTHIAVDGNTMIVSTDNYLDGFLLYENMDTNNDGMLDTWVFNKTFSLSSAALSDIMGYVSGIYDLVLSGDTFAVSLDMDETQSAKDQIYIFENIHSSELSDLNECTLLTSSSGYTINRGEDMVLVNDILFWTERSDALKSNINYYDILTDTEVASPLSYNSSINTEMSIAAAYDSLSGIYSLAVTGVTDDSITVWSDITVASITTVLSCDLDNNSTNDVITRVDMNSTTIIASIPSYESNKGAVAVFNTGTNLIWDAGSTDLTAKLTNPATAVEKNIGLNAIELSDSGGKVFSTVENNRIYAWDISVAITTTAVDDLITPLLFTSGNTITSLVSSDLSGQVISGVPALNKNISGITETGGISVFQIPYSISQAADPTVPAGSDLSQILAGGFTNNFGVTYYIEDFGAHIAEDNGVMIITSDNLYDGFMMYTYTLDWNSDGTADGWEYQNTFYADPEIITGLEVGINNIYDLDIDGDTFAISIYGAESVVLVYEDILNSSRSNGLHETAILADDGIQNSNIFGEDIDIVDGIIYVTDRTDTTGYSKIYVYNQNTGTGVYGTLYSGKISLHDSEYIYSSTDNTEITIAADKRTSGTDAYTLAATGIADSIVKVWATEGGTTTTDGGVELSFIPYLYGGVSNTAAVISNIAVEEGIIIASVPSYSTVNYTDIGAIVAFRGVDGVWTANEFTSDGNASINAVLVADPASGYTGSIGLDDIALSEDHSTVYATSSGTSGNAVLVWHHDEEATPSEYTYFQTADVILTGIDSTKNNTDIEATDTGQVIAGSIYSSKNISGVMQTGVANVLNPNQPSPFPDVDVTSTYTPGLSGQDPENPEGHDFGTVTFNMSESILVSEFSTNMTIKIGHYNELNEFIEDVQINSTEAEALLTAGNGTSITIDLNDTKYSDLTFGESYTIIVPSGMFADRDTASVNPEVFTFNFTISEEAPSSDTPAYIPPATDSTPHSQTPDSNDNPADTPSLGDLADLLDGGLGDGISSLLGLNGGTDGNDPLANADDMGAGADSGIPSDIGDALGLNDDTPSEQNEMGGEEGDGTEQADAEDQGSAEGEGDGNGDATEGGEGEAAEGNDNGEATAGAEGQNNGEQGENHDADQAANRPVDSNSPKGPAQQMMIQNPFAENISSQQTQTMFQSSLHAFSSLAGAGESSYGMAQQAMGDTLTTAALVNSSEQVLTAAREFLAMLDSHDSDFNNLEYAMSGSGMTATTGSVSIIIEDAISSMVEARGNALIANDLLRILSINIKGFEDRLAENSFSAGIKRLANCNQKLAYSYEVLNSILKEVQESNDNGDPLSLEELQNLLPEITAHAQEVSLSISEKGDRASQDVLTFLTKRMEQKGIDQENLQAQVDTIFKEWHSNLGLSAPVSADQTTGIDLAHAM